MTKAEEIAYKKDLTEFVRDMKGKVGLIANVHFSHLKEDYDDNRNNLDWDGKIIECISVDFRNDTDDIVDILFKNRLKYGDRWRFYLGGLEQHRWHEKEQIRKEKIKELVK